MEVHKYTEREDGGADLEIELDAEETRLLIEMGLIQCLKNTIAEHEKKFEDRVEDVWNEEEQWG